MKIHNVYLYSVFLILPLSLHSETQVIGATYAIAEPDALQEIRQAASTATWEPAFVDTVLSTPDNPVSLPEAVKDRTRTFTPVYITPFAVTDKDGKVLYPEGFRYNILEHVHLPMRILIFRNDRHHLEWVRENRKASDILLLSGPGLNDVMKDLESPVYLLSDRIAKRLGLEMVPAIVEQENHHFLIQEFNLVSPDN